MVRAALKVGDPIGKERVELRKRFTEDRSERSEWIVEVRKVAHPFDGSDNRASSVRDRCCDVDRSRIACPAILQVDLQDLIHHLILPDVDVGVAKGSEQGFEDFPGYFVLASEGCRDPLPEVVIDLGRFGATNSSRGGRKALHFFHNRARRRCWSPAFCPGGCPSKKRILKLASRSELETIQEVHDEFAKLLGRKGAKSAVEVLAAFGTNHFSAISIRFAHGRTLPQAPARDKRTARSVFSSTSRASATLVRALCAATAPLPLLATAARAVLIPTDARGPRDHHAIIGPAPLHHNGS